MANLLQKIDDNVKHIFREHNKEADHWANVGAEGQRKVVFDRKGDADTWKAVKGFWDGRCKDNGEKVSAVWSSKESTEKDGSRSAELQFL